MDAHDIGAHDPISDLDIRLGSLIHYEIKNGWHDPAPVNLHLKLQIATADRPFFQVYQTADFPPDTELASALLGPIAPPDKE
jgi:hypothetical protein